MRKSKGDMSRHILEVGEITCFQHLLFCRLDLPDALSDRSRGMRASARFFPVSIEVFCRVLTLLFFLPF